MNRLGFLAGLAIGVAASGYSDDLTVSWSPVSGAAAYSVHIRSTANVGEFVHGVRGTNFVVESVTAGLTYTVTVAAEGKNGEQGTMSDKLVIAIPPAQTPAKLPPPILDGRITVGKR